MYRTSNLKIKQNIKIASMTSSSSSSQRERRKRKQRIIAAVTAVPLASRKIS